MGVWLGKEREQLGGHQKRRYNLLEEGEKYGVGQAGGVRVEETVEGGLVVEGEEVEQRRPGRELVLGGLGGELLVVEVEEEGIAGGPIAQWLHNVSIKLYIFLKMRKHTMDGLRYIGKWSLEHFAHFRPIQGLGLTLVGSRKSIYVPGHSTRILGAFVSSLAQVTRVCGLLTVSYHGKGCLEDVLTVNWPISKPRLAASTRCSTGVKRGSLANRTSIFLRISSEIGCEAMLIAYLLHCKIV